MRLPQPRASRTAPRAHRTDHRTGRRTTALRTAVTAALAVVVPAAVLVVTPPATAVGSDAPVVVELDRPSAASVRVGSAYTISGQIHSTDPAEAAGRTVRLHLSTPNGPLAMGSSATSAPDGRFTLAVPTWWAWQGTLLAKVDQKSLLSGVLAALESAATAATGTHLGYAAAGRTTSWRPLMAGFRYNPCTALTYRVNPVGAPRGGVATVHEAFRRIAAASGLRFRYAGTTAAMPYNKVGRRQYAPGTELTVAWATPRQVPQLRGGVVGVGGSGGYRAADGSKGVYSYGGVTIDRTFRALRGFGRGHTLGALMLHELAHAIGLDHVGDGAQVLYPALRQSTVGRYGAGDLAGLREVGASKGCATLSVSSRVDGRSIAGPAGPDVVRFAPDPHVYRAR